MDRREQEGSTKFWLKKNGRDNILRIPPRSLSIFQINLFFEGLYWNKKEAAFCFIKITDQLYSSRCPVFICKNG